MPRKKTTQKLVQATEDKPFTFPQVDAKPEIGTDPWEDDGLTLKQRRFCQYYVSEAAGNATKAAQLAGYRDDNLITLGGTAHENLKKPQIRGYISRLLAKQGMTPDFLKSRLAQLAQSSLDNMLTMDADGTVRVDLEQAARMGALGQLKELREDILPGGSGKDEVIRRTVKVHDPIRAIELLAKMLGMVTERHEVSVPNGGPVETQVKHTFDYDDFKRRFDDFAKRGGGRLSADNGN